MFKDKLVIDLNKFVKICIRPVFRTKKIIHAFLGIVGYY
jgi:hypothetical protein